MKNLLLSLVFTGSILSLPFAYAAPATDPCEGCNQAMCEDGDCQQGYFCTASCGCCPNSALDRLAPKAKQ